MARSLGVHRGGLSTPGKTALPGPSQVRFLGCWRALCSLVFNDLSHFEPSRRGASLRRTLEVISLGLFLVGLELATGTPSLTVVRLREALAHPLGSDAAEGVAWRSLAGIGLVAGAIILACLTVAVRYRQKGILDHVGCPTCGARTKRVRRNLRQRILGRVLGKVVSARRCGDCGWTGLSYSR